MKNLITLLLLLLLSVSSYSQTTYSEDSVIEYYNKITLKSEYGSASGSRKWKYDVKIYIEGDTSYEVKNEIDSILIDLNDIVETINISIVNNKTDANSFLFIGDFNTFKTKYNINININNNNEVNGCASTFSCGHIIVKSRIFISNKINGRVLKSALREEITQSLGFTNDSWLYSDSIFYQGGTYNCKFSELDKKIIKLHYRR